MMINTAYKHEESFIKAISKTIYGNYGPLNNMFYSISRINICRLYVLQYMML